MAKRRTIRRKSTSSSSSSRRSSTGRSSSTRSTRSRRTTRRPRQERAQPMRFELTERQRREILGLVLLLLAVVTLLSFFSGPAPSGVGFQWYAAVRQLFGLGGFLLPLVLGIFGVLILLGELKHESWLDWNDILGGVLIFLALLAILAVFWGQNGGGLLGDAIAGALSGVIGKVATFFLFLIIGLIGAMMAFDVSIQHIVALFTVVGVSVGNLLHRASRQPTLTIRRGGEEVAPRRRRLLPAMEGEIVPAPSYTPEEEVEDVEEEYAGEEEEDGEEEEPLPRIIGHTEQRAGTLSTVIPLSGAWQLPSLDLLETSGEAEISQAEIRRQARMIEETLASFNVQARVVEVNCGPTVTQFALQPGTGVKVSKITALSNDLALALSASSIRIEAPVPGRPVIGVEIPNTAISLVSLREILETEIFQAHKGALRVALGRDVSGQAVVDDLTKMPHFLIAGTTGSGKSVCINALIVALLYQHTPDSLRFIMIDPKRVELSIFQDIPHLAFPVVTEINGRKVGPAGAGETVDALKALYWTTQEMERRYRIFAREGFRNIAGYNKAARAESNPNLPPMPYLVFVIDELADLMMVAPDEAETMICRLAQLARATGIHLVLATQRPSVDVVTGLIKANFPSRISFAVSSSVDSRVVLDMVGAEQLLGRGDALYMAPDSAKPIRIQGSFVADEEIERIVNFWKAQQPETRSSNPVQLSMPLTWHEEEDSEPEDALLPDAIALVRKHNRASAALLQRRLRVSFNRASRLIDLLEHKGVVGPEAQGRSREVLLEEEYEKYEE